MLNDQQLKDIEGLQQICEEHDKCQLKLNWDMLRERQNNLDDYLHYKDGSLIGFLALYGFGSSYELCGMIHPQHREKGIFKDLFHQSIDSLKERGVKKLLINAPGSSDSGKAFLDTLPAEYAFSEYQMKWEHKNLEEVSDEEIKLTPARPGDREFILELDYLCFNVERDDSLEFMEMVGKDEDSSSFIINHKGERVGKIHVKREADKSYIFGFAVHPSQQGKGIGRQVLQKTVINESKDGQAISLEVEAKNANALKLYEGTGFVSYQVQDYYTYKGL